MGFRHWIKKTAKKAGKEIEKTAKDAGKGIDDLVNKAEKSGMSVIDDIKNLANIRLRKKLKVRLTGLKMKLRM